MELRKDPITRSWVVVGHREDTCRNQRGLSVLPSECGFPEASCCGCRRTDPGKSMVLPHPDPLYRVEGDPEPPRRRDLRHHAARGRRRNRHRDARARQETRRFERRSDSDGDGGLEAAHRGSEARPPVQVCFRLQELRRAGGPGRLARAFANYRDHVCAQKNSLRTARGARMVSRKKNAACSATS